MILIMEDGEKRTIAIKKLSQADQDFVAKQDADSPFEKTESKGGEPAASNFNEAAPFTEWIDMACLSLRVEGRLD